MADDQLWNDEVAQLSWFHYNITRHVAETLLYNNAEDGSYLLRCSGTRKGEYSLSVRAANSVKHFEIGWDGTQYTFGMGKFQTLKDFVEHFENKPLIGGQSGVLTLLKYPYPRDVQEPEQYETVRVHAEWGKSRNMEEAGGADKHGGLSIGSKEGYLTKIGAIRKSWKTRWFVLMKNELKYYKNKGDVDAIKVLDLSLCTEVEPDASMGKGNCFRIVMPERTFYCYASSPHEAEEWIQVLQWKVRNLRAQPLQGTSTPS